MGTARTIQSVRRRQRTWRLAAAATIFPAAVSLQVLQAGPACAVGCDPVSAGGTGLTRYQSANVYLGSAAVITRDDPFICGSNYLSAAWVGIQGNNYGEFAQIGWVEYNGFPNRYFYWLGTGSVVFIANLPDTQTWKGDSFSVAQGLGSPNQVYMFMTTNEGSSYSYTVNKAVNPTMAEWLGEVQHLQTQSPGRTSAKTHFTNARKYYNGQWWNQIINSADLHSDLWFQAKSSSGGDDFYIWDSRF